MKDSCVVLADDDITILEGLRGLIETMFGRVVMVADRPSLYEALKQIKPNLAIVDLSLLDIDDLLNANDYNKVFHNVKLIILSDYDEPEIVDRIILAGASGFVLKQYVAIDLFDAIANIKKGLTFISPAVKEGRSRGT